MVVEFLRSAGGGGFVLCVCLFVCFNIEGVCLSDHISGSKGEWETVF